VSRQQVQHHASHQVRVLREIRKFNGFKSAHRSEDTPFLRHWRRQIRQGARRRNCDANESDTSAGDSTAVRDSRHRTWIQADDDVTIRRKGLGHLAFIAHNLAWAAVHDRYEIAKASAKGGMGEVVLSTTGRPSSRSRVKIRPPRGPERADEEALRRSDQGAIGVEQNICRSPIVSPSAYGPILVMEHITGPTLHTHIRRKKAKGGIPADEFRRIAATSAGCRGDSTFHASSTRTQDGTMSLSRSNPTVRIGRGIVLGIGFAKEPPVCSAAARLRGRRYAPTKANGAHSVPGAPR